MEITRNVVLDLLPLYLAEEVSADTRAIVEKYLESDPELANVVKHSARIELSSDIPVPLSQDNKLRDYRKAKRLLTLRTLILAGLISVALVITIILFFFSSP